MAARRGRGRPAGVLGHRRALAARCGRRALARRAARRPGVLRGPPDDRGPGRLAARQGRVLRPAPGAGAAAAAVDVRPARRRARHRAPGAEPLALRRDGGARGRRPRAPRSGSAGSTAWSATTPPALAAPGARVGAERPDLAARSGAGDGRLADLDAVRRRRRQSGDPTGAAPVAAHAVGQGDRTPLGRRSARRWTSVVDLAPGDGAAATNARGVPADRPRRRARAVARTLRGDVGVSTVTVDSGNWDMHVGLGTRGSAGWRQRRATSPRCIAAFFADLGPAADKVTLVTISEFGRRVQENANRGLDHGWGNVMLVAGAGVKGGQLLRHVARLTTDARRRPPGDHGLPQRAGGDRRRAHHRVDVDGLPRLPARDAWG